MTERIEITHIRRDGGTQSRMWVNNDVAGEYADRLLEGETFPPVIVFHDGVNYWLADGFHRLEAHIKAGKAAIDADVRQGTQRDAILFSTAANADHGLRRSNADKRRAVGVLLRDPEWRGWSDREIARQVKVDHKTVSSIRSELERSGEIPKADARTGSDGRTVTIPQPNQERRAEVKIGDEVFCISEHRSGIVKNIDRLIFKVDIAGKEVEVYHQHAYRVIKRASRDDMTSNLTPVFAIGDRCTTLGRKILCTVIDVLVLYSGQYAYEVKIDGGGTLVGYGNYFTALVDEPSPAPVFKHEPPKPVPSVALDEPPPDFVPAVNDTYKVGDVVITRAGRVGTITAISGRQISVETSEGERVHYPDTIRHYTAADDESEDDPEPVVPDELKASGIYYSLVQLTSFIRGEPVNSSATEHNIETVRAWLEKIEAKLSLAEGEAV